MRNIEKHYENTTDKSDIQLNYKQRVCPNVILDVIKLKASIA